MPRGIAIDWVAGNVYWTDSGRDVIEVAQMKGENRKTLISGMIDEPHAIVVDPLRGWARLGGGVWAGAEGGPQHPRHTLSRPAQPGPQVFPAAPLWPSPVSLRPGLPRACSAGPDRHVAAVLGGRVWAAPWPQGPALPA